MGIRTATLAEIYARQGHLEQAYEIYAELLAASPEDASLRERVETLRGEVAHAAADDRSRARVDRLRALLSRIQSRRRRS